MQVISKFFQRRRAQSMVEFALVVPVLLLLILGVIELGYTLFVYTEVENAAREGARAAAVRPCPTSADTQAIAAAITARMPALVDSTSVVSSTVYPSGQNYGDPVNVTVTYQFELLDPLITAFVPQITVNATASRTLTTDCDSLVSVAPTAVPTSVIDDGSGGGSGDGTGTEPTATVEPTPLPIFVSLAASKETESTGGGSKPLTLRVRVTRGSGTGIGVSGMVVTVRVQSTRSSSNQTITMPATDSNGYAQAGCSSQYTFRRDEQLTISTDALANPPGGVPADGITGTVDTSGTSVCQ